MTLEDLIQSGVFSEEFDKMFDKPLTEAEKAAIEYYYASLLGKYN